MHWKLVEMSAKFGTSKSATAEDLLKSAIADAWIIFFNSLEISEQSKILNKIGAQLEWEAEADFNEWADDELRNKIAAYDKIHNPNINLLE